MAYPVYSDVVTYSAQAGVSCPASGLVNDFIDNAVLDWDSLVGYTFSPSGSGIYEYNCSRNGRVPLPPFQTITAVYLNDALLVEDSGYFLEDRAITLNVYSEIPGALKIHGTIGYSSIPKDVYFAVMDLVIDRIMYSNPQRVFTKLKQNDVQLDFGQARDLWDNARRVARRYR